MLADGSLIAATNSAVRPVFDARLTSAPRLVSSCTFARSVADQIRAVAPKPFRALTSAPLSRSSVIASTDPTAADVISSGTPAASF